MRRTGRILHPVGTITVAVLIAACLPGSAPVARAGLLDVRIDFGGGWATTPTNWNMAHQNFLSVVTPAGSEQAMIDFNEPSTATGVKLKVTKAFFGSGATEASPTFTWANDEASWVETDALRDWTMAYTANNLSCQFALIGLDPNEIYCVELLAVRGTAGIGSYQVNGTAGEAVFPAGSTATATTAAWNSSIDGHAAKGFMQWSHVTPSIGGTIVVDVVKATGAEYAFLNAMRITAVPEPGTSLLLAAGLLAIVRRRRGRMARANQSAPSTLPTR